MLKNENETRILQKKISQITKKRGNFFLQKDIEIIRDTKIPINYSEKTGKDYLEYIRNCRFYWRHFYIERILQITLDKLVEIDLDIGIEVKKKNQYITIINSI